MSKKKASTPTHIAAIHRGRKEKIEVKNTTPITSVAKLHKNTIRNSRGAIRQLRKEKRQDIRDAKRQARNQFKLSSAPHKHTIKMTKLLLKQVRTTAKLQKLADQ